MYHLRASFAYHEICPGGIVPGFFVLLLTLVVPTEAFAIAMITECSNPSGKGIDIQPEYQNWHDEVLDNTKVVFIRVGMREYDVIIKQGGRTNEVLSAHSPFVKHVYEDDNNLTIATVSPLGISETFQMSQLSDNQRYLFWNIMKNNTPPLRKSKVVTYVLKCEDR